jgi:transposase-like protein
MAKHYPVEQRQRAVKMVLDHLDEYRSVYAACQSVGPKVGVGAESLRRWVLQAQVDVAQRPGVTSAEAQRIASLNGRTGISRRPTRFLRQPHFLRAGARPAPPLICGFVDQMRTAGYRVESICAVLCEQGVQVAPRTYRNWKTVGPSAPDSGRCPHHRRALDHCR